MPEAVLIKKRCYLIVNRGFPFRVTDGDHKAEILLQNLAYFQALPLHRITIRSLETQEPMFALFDGLQVSVGQFR